MPAAAAAIRVHTPVCTVLVRVSTVAEQVGVALVQPGPHHTMPMVIAMIMPNISLISSSSRAAVATPHPQPHPQLLRHLLPAAHRAAALRAIIAMAATTINCNCSRLPPLQAIIIRTIISIIRRIIITLCLASSQLAMVMATQLKHLLFLAPALAPYPPQLVMIIPRHAMAAIPVAAAAVSPPMVAAIIVMSVPIRVAMTMV